MPVMWLIWMVIGLIDMHHMVAHLFVLSAYLCAFVCLYAWHFGCARGICLTRLLRCLSGNANRFGKVPADIVKLYATGESVEINQRQAETCTVYTIFILFSNKFDLASVGSGDAKLELGKVLA